MQQLSGNFTTFLTLLTTQLKNQDPTSPMDSNQFTQQLVMFSQVEQQINTNDNLQDPDQPGHQPMPAAMAATYLGKKVTVTNGKASLTGGAANWTYNLGTAAATTRSPSPMPTARSSITGAGETAAGNHTFTWNGKDINGNQLRRRHLQADRRRAADSAGTTITSSVASAGTVSEIDMTSGTPQAGGRTTWKLGLADIAAAMIAEIATDIEF